MEAGSWSGAGRSEAKDLLRLITCGSVDDGKSTLIGRLLHDSQLIMDDQLAALAADSVRHGTIGNELDFALLVDGLEAEREQGITIDVAYRFFTTPRRSFMVADTPGHEQYTRNMATGASNAQLAIILIDARKGVLIQTRRHSFICALLGIRHVVLAVNKIDLVDYGKDAFERIVADYRAFAAALGFISVVPIPLSARHGDNVITRSANTPWYDGPCLLDYLERIDVQSEMASRSFRFPVQWVNRPDSEFRGYAGTVASGSIAPGDDIVVAASGQLSRVARIVTSDGDLARAVAGDAVTITLADDIDVGRGDMLARPSERPDVADQFAAHLIWMDQDALLPGRSYILRIGTRSGVPASVTSIKYKIDVNTREHLAAHGLALNEIGFCNLATALPVSFDSYEMNRRTGAFIVIDRYTNRTVGAGMIAFALRRAANIAWQPLSIGRKDRAGLKNQRPCIVWFTGLSGAGKSTLATALAARLAARRSIEMLDGDEIRLYLSQGLGYSRADRDVNVHRIAYVARMLAKHGVLVLAAVISPYAATRAEIARLSREAGHEFVEVFVNAPLAAVEARDVKGLYAKARRGELERFTGISDPYEAPTAPAVEVRTDRDTPEVCVQAIVDALAARGLVE